MHRQPDRRSQGMPRTLTAPEISHTQFFVLFQIARGVRKAKALREALGGEKISQRLPTFFAFMARLQDAGLVTRDLVEATGGARGKESIYSLTASGRKAIKDVREFYRRLDRQARG